MERSSNAFASRKTGLGSKKDIRRILVIRAGALGDTILMLPLLKALRYAFPQAYLEAMGYAERLQVALGEPYAHQISSIDRRGLEAFFVKDSALPTDLVKFFGSFDLILSYKRDPEGRWTENLRKTGVRQAYTFNPFPPEETPVHITTYLLKTLAGLGVEVEEGAPKIYPPPWAREEAEKFWKENRLPAEGERAVFAVHPGSGSLKKVWPPTKFAEVCRGILEQYQGHVLLISGPADTESVRKVLAFFPDKRSPLLVDNKPLLVLAAILERCRAYIGNDSGVTHLAAAVDLPVVALFGPTDPRIWRPLGKKVKILQAGTQAVGFNQTGPRPGSFYRGLEQLEVGTVMEALRSIL